MRAVLLILSLLLACSCLLPLSRGQAPYGAMGESATQYQHRWTDELEFAMLHQQMQPSRQQQTNFVTQQVATAPPPSRITDARRPHTFVPIAAIATGQQRTVPRPDTTQPRVSIPMSNVIIDSVTPADADFDTAGADARDELDTQGFPVNETIAKRARAACSLSCDEGAMVVTGEGRVRINSTRALIRATIEFKEQLKTAVLASSATAAPLHALLLSASNQTAAAASIVIRYLQSDEWRGRMWQLHTTSMLVEPIYQYVNGTQLTNGYRASLSFSLQASTVNTSDILTGMLERGVTRIDSVGYEAAEADTVKARQQAVRRAVEDALQQAATAVQGMKQTLRRERGDASKADYTEDLQVISMRVTGLSMPTAQIFYPSQTRMFGLSRATSRLFVDESVMSIPIIAEDKIITATVLMKVRF